MSSVSENDLFGPDFDASMDALAARYCRITNAVANILYNTGFHVRMRELMTSKGLNQRDTRTYLVRGVERAFERAGKRVSATTANRVVTRFLPAKVPKKIRKTMQNTPFPQTPEEVDTFLATL